MHLFTDINKKYLSFLLEKIISRKDAKSQSLEIITLRLLRLCGHRIQFCANIVQTCAIGLNVYAVKPTVSIIRVGFVFLFPNLGEFSNAPLTSVKGVLKRENGTVLATFEKIGKDNFSELKIYNFFGATASVFLELYKPETTDPYAGIEPIRVQIIQNIGANMIVLQEKLVNGNLVVKGDTDVADYLN